MKTLIKSIDTTLIYGKKEEIENLKCGCGGKIHFNGSIKEKSLRYWCDGECGMFTTMINVETIPSCLSMFGEKGI